MYNKNTETLFRIRSWVHSAVCSAYVLLLGRRVELEDPTSTTKTIPFCKRCLIYISYQQKKYKKNKKKQTAVCMFLTLGVDFLLILYHWSSQKITSGKILK